MGDFEALYEGAKRGIGGLLGFSWFFILLVIVGVSVVIVVMHEKYPKSRIWRTLIRVITILFIVWMLLCLIGLVLGFIFTFIP
jgi:hypothetical protein